MRVRHATTVEFCSTIDVTVLYQDEPPYQLRIAKGQRISGVNTAFHCGGVEMFDILDASGRTFTNIPYRMVRFV